MHDSKGVEFERGDIFVNEHGNHRRVDFVVSDKIITASYGSDVAEARKSRNEGSSWSQREATAAKFVIVERRPLGVKDSNGNEWHYGDKAVEGDVVIGAVPSRNGDGKDYILMSTLAETGGWRFEKSHHYTIDKSARDMIVIDGKEFSKATIKKALSAYVA